MPLIRHAGRISHLSKLEKEKIIRLFKQEQLSRTALAERFSVSPPLISSVIRKWKKMNG